jgi:DNA-binding CsgD family transcriptional regulator
VGTRDLAAWDWYGGGWAAAPQPGGQPMDTVKLTGREREALKFLAKGYTRPQAAKVLRIESTTLRVHIHNAKDKLGAQTDREAIDRANALGLLGPPQMPEGVPKEWAALTPRELELLEKLINDLHVLTDSQLARLLVVTVATVRKHLQNIYRKLGIHSRASAVLVAVKVFTRAALSSAGATWKEATQ